MPVPTSGKVVLVTGAGSGIGAATARLLAERGHHVVLGARRKRLKELTDDSAQPAAAPSTTPSM